MRIAILGATSQIAKDLIQSFSGLNELTLTLFARRPQAVISWLRSLGINKDWDVIGYEGFNTKKNFDAIINFVGVGDPAQAAAMGASIFDVTRQYDDLIIDYLKSHPNCRYIFLSSGAAYGSMFDKPADENTVACIPINNLQPQDWYGVAKLHAECRHRSLTALPIVDIRVFNYFSHTQDMDSRFLIADMVRAIRDNVVLITSPENIFRDYLDPVDFFQLIIALLRAAPSNDVVDCYSKSPIDKLTILDMLQNKYGLRYKFSEGGELVNSTGSKLMYFSLNRRAAKYGYKPGSCSQMHIGRSIALYLEGIKAGMVR